MWPDRVSNPGPLTYESGALTTAPRGPAVGLVNIQLILCIPYWCIRRPIDTEIVGCITPNTDVLYKNI